MWIQGLVMLKSGFEEEEDMEGAEGDPQKYSIIRLNEDLLAATESYMKLKDQRDKLEAEQVSIEEGINKLQRIMEIHSQKEGAEEPENQKGNQPAEPKKPQTSLHTIQRSLGNAKTALENTIRQRMSLNNKINELENYIEVKQDTLDEVIAAYNISKDTLDECTKIAQQNLAKHRHHETEGDETGKSSQKSVSAHKNVGYDDHVTEKLSVYMEELSYTVDAIVNQFEEEKRKIESSKPESSENLADVVSEYQHKAKNLRRLFDKTQKFLQNVSSELLDKEREIGQFYTQIQQQAPPKEKTENLLPERDSSTGAEGQAIKKSPHGVVVPKLKVQKLGHEQGLKETHIPHEPQKMHAEHEHEGEMSQSRVTDLLCEIHDLTEQKKDLEENVGMQKECIKQQKKEIKELKDLVAMVLKGFDKIFPENEETGKKISEEAKIKSGLEKCAAVMKELVHREMLKEKGPSSSKSHRQPQQQLERISSYHITPKYSNQRRSWLENPEGLEFLSREISDLKELNKSIYQYVSSQSPPKVNERSTKESLFEHVEKNLQSYLRITQEAQLTMAKRITFYLKEARKYAESITCMQQASERVDFEEIMVLATRIMSNFDHIDTELKSYLKTETQQRKYLEHQAKPASHSSESKSKGRSTATSSDSKTRGQDLQRAVKSAKPGRKTVLARDGSHVSQHSSLEAIDSQQKLHDLIKQKYAQMNISIEPAKESGEPTTKSTNTPQEHLHKIYAKIKSPPAQDGKHLSDKGAQRYFSSASPKTTVQERSRQGSIPSQSKLTREGIQTSKFTKSSSKNISKKLWFITVIDLGANRSVSSISLISKMLTPFKYEDAKKQDKGSFRAMQRKKNKTATSHLI